MTPTPKTRRLNITNGDSAAGTLREAGIEGKIVPWRDVLHEGPVDSSLPLEELSRQRARFIADESWADIARVSADFVERDRTIQNLEHTTEVVLWFEDDLYDQLQLIQLLDFFAGAAAKDTKLSLVVVDGYIPPLSVAEIKALDKKRPAVTRDQLDLGRKAWRAFGSPDPTSIVRLLDDNTSSLPYLARALTRHLEEFPSTTNGLSRSEREALTVIAAGHNTPVRAFLEVAKLQESIFLGDSVFYSYLERLSGKDPLLTWKDGEPVVAPDAGQIREFVEGELTLTPLGHDVLAGRKDWQQINRKPRWLGGVEIAPGGEGWRWNPETRDIVKSAAERATKPARKGAKRARKAAKTSKASRKTSRKKK